MEFPQNQEIWRAVDGYINYEVSSHGRIRNSTNGKILKTQKRNEYERVGIRNDEGKTKMITVHRFVAEAFVPNPENKKFVDHINKDRNNNFYQNLRWATHAENMRNKEMYKKNKTGLKGVHFRKGRFFACIRKDGTLKHIGYFDNKEDAARAYDKKAKELFGEFATLNFED